MNKRFRTAIFGFSKIAYGYGDDKKYKRVSIPTHFEAIKTQNLDLDTVIDADENALKNANEAGVKNLFNDIEMLMHRSDCFYFIMSASYK